MVAFTLNHHATAPSPDQELASVRQLDWLRLLLRLAPAFFVFFALTAAFQWYNGAFHGEFGGHSDEASHVVTGLMVRDYVAALAPTPPMQYAENYYLHYPKVGFGHWPPLFYIVEAAWMLLFPPSRVTLLLLITIFTAILASMLYETLRREFSAKAGLAAGVLLLSLPIVHPCSRTVMVEIPVAVLIYSAVLMYGRYLDNPRWPDGVWFGIIASLACLTKGSGLLLALVPVFSLLFTHRFRLLGRFSFWAPALIVLVMTSPWYFFVPNARHQAVDLSGGVIPFMLDVGQFHVAGQQIWSGVGGVLVLFIVAGVFRRLVWPSWKGEALSGKWVASAALVLALLAFRMCVLPAHGFRHLAYIAAPLLMFAVAGVSWACANWPLKRFNSRWRTRVVGLVVVGLVAGYNYGAPKTPYRGFAEVARDLVSALRFRHSVSLVSSDARGEGMMVAGVALRESRPGHIVLRGSKMLADESWMGSSYRLRYSTPDAVMDYLRSVPVALLVMDSTPSRKSPHYQLLEEMLERYANDWELVGTYPREHLDPLNQGQIRVYHLIGCETNSPPNIRIDMTSRLGRFLQD